MRPRDRNLGSTVRFLYFKQVDLEALAWTVMLDSDLFAGRQDGFGLTEVDVHVAGFKSVDDARNDVAFLAGVLLEDDFSFRLAESLQNHLLCGLRGDTAGVVREDFDLDDVADIGVRRERLRGLEVNLKRLFCDILFDLNDSLAGQMRACHRWSRQS